MASNASRRARERRLRARYRRKIWLTGFIMLLIGLIAGYVLTTYFMDDIIALLPEKLRPAQSIEDTTPVEATPQPTPTPAPMLTQEPDNVISFNLSDAPAVAAVEVTPTPVPTAEPTAEPTAVPTEVPTAVPTAEPTAVPTVAPTAEPTEEPVEENSVDMSALLANMIANVQASATEEAVVVVETVAPEAETEVVVEEATEIPVVIATPQPTPEVDAEPVIVPYGEAITFDTQINADGSARRDTASEDFETLSLTLNVDAYKNPEYFEANYSKLYDLQGTEAAVEFGVTLNGYTGNTEIIPQNFLLITFIGEDLIETTQGFQLMDKEIGGKTEIAVTSDTPATLYKRYPYNADQGDMEYMVVTAYNDGEESVYWFEIHDPNPDPTPTPYLGMTVGSSGEDVVKLQAKLIELGLLQGQPDGKFGNFTAEAVKTLQGRYGMEKTGIADEDFLDKLYN